jgi:serine/threonine protein kinase
MTEDIVYQQGRRLGCGTFGQVYEAINLISGEMIAVKRVELRPEQAPAMVRAVQAEIQALTRLQHPNIVRLMGCKMNDKRMDVFMELVSGNSLYDLIQTMGAFDEQLIRRYTKQMLLGLQYCHSQGVLHRDIKAKNILLATDGLIKLGDFGSAKVVFGM